MELTPNDFPKGRIKDFEPISEEVLALVPERMVLDHLVVPVSKNDGRLTAVVTSATPSFDVQNLQVIVGCPIDFLVASEQEIRAFITDHFPIKGPAASLKLEKIGPQAPLFSSAFEKLILDAVLNQASEVIVERHGDQVLVRERIRGVLITVSGTVATLESTRKLFANIRKKGRVQIYDKVSLAEASEEFSFGGKKLICAMILSESPAFDLLTIHMLRGERPVFDPESWGMGPQQGRVLEGLLEKRQGVIIFCGSDRDGITETAYSCAKKIASPQKQLMGVEFYQAAPAPFIKQFFSGGDVVQFDNLLSLAFRHSPDVVLVNSLQKKEHFEFVFSEALKGCLALCRFHSLDAADTVARLVAMGLENHLIGSALVGVVTQRRLRLNCPYCQEKDPAITRELAKDYGVPLAMQPLSFYRGRGCEKCLQTGFDRETSVFEVLGISEEMKAHLGSGFKSSQIEIALKTAGSMTLRQIALHKAINGQTTLLEALRVSS